MSGSIEAIGDVGEEERIDPFGFAEEIRESEQLRSRRLTPVEENTNKIASEIIPNVAVPARLDTLNPGCISDIPLVAESVDAAAASTGVKDPKLAQETIKAGLASIELKEDEIRKIDDKIRETLALIQKIQTLSGKIPPVNADKNVYELSAEVHELAKFLKEKGVELPINGEKTLTREQIEALKSQLASLIEKYNLDVRIDFTKINTYHGALTAITDVLKAILRLLEKMIETFCRNQTPR